ncbi:MAG: phosphoribosylamine--glycine ligase [Candidatus Eremiobacterota bacterium]
MNVLLIGSGGREHALAWKLSQTCCVRVSPGNAGTALIPRPAAVGGCEGSVKRWPEGIGAPLATVLARQPAPEAVESWAAAHADLVVVGPEAPLAEGLTDRLKDRVRVFGPTRRAAEIESSKAFAKEFMTRHGIPTAAFAVAETAEQARAFLRKVPDAVLKYSGLAGGKGVLVPDSPEAAETAVRRLLEEREFGPEPVVLEERLTGREVSLMAFSDGTTVRPMVPAVDHKRLLDGDRGPNTGGMGAFAPAPDADVAGWTRTVLEPAVRGLAEEERPFVGVLYAGLMLTPAGVRVLEFNCRFGDPETQVVVPLLQTDLAEVACACAEGRLADLKLTWRDGAAACVVMTAAGYPGTPRKGDVIYGLERDLPDTLVFHAGTALAGDRVVTSGGRVLGVTGLGRDLPEAVERAYRRAETLSFEGCHYRRDIGPR